MIDQVNTPGVRGGPGGHERTLAVKEEKTAENQIVGFTDGNI